MVRGNNTTHLLAHVVFPVQAVHQKGIDEDQYDEYVDRALLGEPEAELEATNTNLIELFDEQYAEAVGADEPDGQTKRDEAQVGSPVCEAVVAMHYTLSPNKKSGFFRSRFLTNVSTWFLAP